MDLKNEFSELAKNTADTIKIALEESTKKVESANHVLRKQRSFFDVDYEIIEPYKNEIENNIKSWFAALFDSVNPNIKVEGFDKDLLEKMLKKVEYQKMNYRTNMEAQTFGKAAMLLFKQNDYIDMIPCRLIYEKYINNKMISVSLTNGIIYETNTVKYNLMWTFYLRDRNVYYRSWWVNASGDPVADETSKSLFEKNGLTEIIDEILFTNVDEILCVVKRSNNYLERPTLVGVENKIIQAANYDAALTNLPLWESGMYVEASFAVSELSEGKQTMRDLMYEKNRKLNLRTAEPSELGVLEIARYAQPTSIQQTVLNSYKEIMRHIRQSLGIPALDDSKSAQQTSDEIVRQQFLSSPQLEQSRNVYERYIEKLLTNYIIVSKLNRIPGFESVDENKLNVEVKFDLPVSQTLEAKTNTKEVSEEKQDEQ